MGLNFCPHCGNKVQSDSNFCTNCGKSLKESKDSNDINLRSSDIKKQTQKKNSIVKETWFCILMLVLIFPFGLFLMWYYKKFNKKIRIAITFLACVAAIISVISEAINDSNIKISEPIKQDISEDYNTDKDLGIAIEENIDTSL